MFSARFICPRVDNRGWFVLNLQPEQSVHLKSIHSPFPSFQSLVSIPHCESYIVDISIRSWRITFSCHDPNSSFLLSYKGTLSNNLNFITKFAHQKNTSFKNHRTTIGYQLFARRNFISFRIPDLAYLWGVQG